MQKERKPENGPPRFRPLRGNGWPYLVAPMSRMVGTLLRSSASSESGAGSNFYASPPIRQSPHDDEKHRNETRTRR
jgi:hypothetical protein